MKLLEWLFGKKCKHLGEYRELMSCDAVCCQCGANLGFIASWAEKHKNTPTVKRSRRPQSWT